MARRRYYRGYLVSSGISMGSALAMILSYVEHNSIIWAIISGFFSWIYVLYYIIMYRLLG